MIEWSKCVLSLDASVQDAIKKLNDTSSRVVLIVDEFKKFVGIIVDGDIRRGLLDGIQLNDEVELIINRNPIVVSPDELVDTVNSIFRQIDIDVIPIVDQNNELCGIHQKQEASGDRARDNLFVIMAGGFGRRMLPLTESIPKPMMKIGNKSLLERLIVNIRECGFKNILISVHYLSEAIEGYFGDGSRFGVQIKYLRENEPLGTAGALSLIEDTYGLPFVVSNADLFSSIDFESMLGFHSTNKCDVTIAVKNYEMQNPFGEVDLMGERVIGIKEKPKSISIISAGAYIFEEKILSLLAANEHLDMPDLLQKAISKPMNVRAFMMHEDWADIATASDLRDAKIRAEKVEQDE